MRIIHPWLKSPINPELIQNPWAQGPDLIYPEKGKVYATRGHPKPCLPCQAHLEETIGFRAQSVVHADLIPTFVGLRIFAAMPQRVRMQALVAAFKGKGALRSAVIESVARVRPPTVLTVASALLLHSGLVSGLALMRRYRRSERHSVVLSRVRAWGRE